MNKWEYTWLFLHREAKSRGLHWLPMPWFLNYPDGTRVEDQQINTAIQKLGDEGWELVTVVPITNFSGDDLLGFTNELQYIFKRPK